MKKRTQFTHIDNYGYIRMVNTTGKTFSKRMARAEAVIHLGKKISSQLRKNGKTAKGSVLETAKLAGIIAAKKTAELIPLCHQIPLDFIDITAKFDKDVLQLESLIQSRYSTGVEMEALTAVTIASLTVYDMCKALDKGISIEKIRLIEKSGGKSGHWLCDKNNHMKTKRSKKHD